MDSGLAGQVGKTDLPAPRNDAEQAHGLASHYRLPAQPRLAISLICSIGKGRGFSLLMLTSGGTNPRMNGVLA
jgi:hypothetical protein